MEERVDTIHYAIRVLRQRRVRLDVEISPRPVRAQESKCAVIEAPDRIDARRGIRDVTLVCWQKCAIVSISSAEAHLACAQFNADEKRRTRTGSDLVIIERELDFNEACPRLVP